MESDLPRVIERTWRASWRVGLLVLVGFAGGPPAVASADSLPLGDGRTAERPTAGRLLACDPVARPRPLRRGWVSKGRWDPDERGTVGGAVRWPEGGLATGRADDERLMTTTGVPDQATGVFPTRRPAPGVGAAIAAQRVDYALPARPRARSRPACLPQGPIGVLSSGAFLYPALDARGNDAAAAGVWDRCDGAPDDAGRYHARRPLACLGDRGRSHSRQIGWALDGYPLFGPRGERGERLRSADLDACHGHTHVIKLDGREARRYHYHATPDFPYTLGCFRGTPRKPLPTIAAPVPSLPPVPAADPAPPPVIDVPTPPAPPPTPDPDPPVTIRSPTLAPAFAPEVTDYVVRCADPVVLTFDAPAPSSISIDGGPARSGQISQTIALAEGQSVRWSVNRAGGTRTYHARCLPEDFPPFTARRTGAPQAQWYITTPQITLGGTPPTPFAAIFDANGVPVWWLKTDTFSRPIDAKLLPNGNLAMTYQFGGAHTAVKPYEELGFDASVRHTWATVGTPTDFHDLQLLASGNALLLSYHRRDGVDLSAFPPAKDDASVLDAEVQELDQAGNVVWSWNSKDHIALSETPLRWWGLMGPEPYDVFHINSVHDDGDGIIVSGRHVDAVYRIDKATGAVDWKLGGSQTPQSLTVLGDDPGRPGPLGGQHDARRLPDGTVTVYDNATGYTSTPPRAVRFRIDPAARTATVLEAITDPGAPGSFCCGATRKLSGGNWVTTWGATPLISEATPAGQRVFSLAFAGGVFTYRTDPVEPGRLDAATLRAGMDAQHPRG